MTQNEKLKTKLLIQERKQKGKKKHEKQIKKNDQIGGGRCAFHVPPIDKQRGRKYQTRGVSSKLQHANNKVGEQATKQARYLKKQ